MTNTPKWEAIILAGGMGSRLAPITDRLPKPLVPVAGMPVMERVTGVLKKNGFDRAVLTVCALPEAFDRYRDPNIPLHMVKGEVPLGSAGCVKSCAHLLSDTFLVISGDTVTDFDLRSVWEKHKKEHRKVTVLLTHAPMTGEFGVVSLRDGVIRAFLEKPTIRDTFSDLISTGIYLLDKEVLEEVQFDKFCDFAGDLFPRLMARGVAIHGEVMEGHWWDIGKPESYYRCAMTLTGGENDLGKDCHIHEQAKVSRSILHDGVTVEKGARATGCILCEGVVLEEGCVVPEGCVIGADTVVEKGVHLPPSTRIKGGMRISLGGKGEKYSFGVAAKRYFDEEGISGSRGELDSAFCLALGRALKTPDSPLTVGILHTPSPCGELYASLLCAGARDAGAKVYEFGKGFPAVCGYAVEKYRLDMAVCVELQESLSRVRIRAVDKDGLPLCGEAQRGIEARLRSGKFDTCIAPLPVVKPEGEETLLRGYCLWLQEQVGSLSGARFAVSRRDEGGEFLGSNAAELGAEVVYGEVSGMDSYTVSPDGRRACVITAGGKELSYWHLVAVCGGEGRENRVHLPARTPHAVEEYLGNMGKTVELYGDSRSPARKNAMENPYVNDGVLLSLLFAAACLRRGKTPDEIVGELPAFAVVKREVPPFAPDSGEDKRGEKIAALCRFSGFPARVVWQTGRVTFFPAGNGGYTLFAEASSWETAEELCAAAEELLE